MCGQTFISACTHTSTKQFANQCPMTFKWATRFICEILSQVVVCCISSRGGMLNFVPIASFINSGVIYISTCFTSLVLIAWWLVRWLQNPSFLVFHVDLIQ
eukprot:725382_1